MIWVNVVEDREAIMARFLNGLNCDPMDLVELLYYIELEDMIHTTTKVERKFKMKGNYDKSKIHVFFFHMKAKL
jgi:hypothetical protein